MAGKQQGDVGCLGVETCVKRCFTRDEEVALVTPSGIEKGAGTSTGHSNMLDRTRCLAYHVQTINR